MRDYTIGRLHGRFVVTWREDGKRRRFRLHAATVREADAEARALLLAAGAARQRTRAKEAQEKRK